LSVKTPLIDQLKTIGVTPADVTYLAFSHFHFDHTGNANAFAASTWIVNRPSWRGPNRRRRPSASTPSAWSAVKTATTRLIDATTTCSATGASASSRRPATRRARGAGRELKKSGVVILSGTLHLEANRKFKRMPVFNHRARGHAASMDRLERIVKNTKARFIVQHDVKESRRCEGFQRIE